MITRLRIRGLGVIAGAEVELAPGMVVFTGETGAGKTMVVSALGLVLGDRFDSALTGPTGAQVEATILVAEDGPVAAAAREAGGRLDPSGDGRAELIVNRSVSAAGRGRAAAGGAAVPLGLLAEMGSHLAQRHSQNDQIALRSPRRQREALDRFGGPELAAALGEYRTGYDRLMALSQQLAEVTRSDDERTARMHRLRAELAEIAEVDPQPDEEHALEETITRLTNAEALRAAMHSAYGRLQAEEPAGDAGSAIGEAMASLRQGARYDAGLAELPARLEEAQALVADVAAELSHRLTDVPGDPDALAALHARKARLTGLLRRYGGSTRAVLDHARAAGEELAGIDAGAEEIERLADEVTQAVRVVADAAERVSRLRREAADRLAEQVTTELAGLAMPQAQFTVLLSRRDDPAGLLLADGRTHAFGPHGVDLVRFLLAPHAGAPPVPLGDGASGGELSRILLALEVVLSASAPPSVYVFDEIDAGIGGRTAGEVGRRLARLARRSQVFVVTHLPQVASFADQHVVVRKDSDGVVTQATVAEVSGADRTAELSRMLSGQDDSQVALAHAEELLDLAAMESRRQGATR